MREEPLPLIDLPGEKVVKAGLADLSQPDVWAQSLTVASRAWFKSHTIHTNCFSVNVRARAVVGQPGIGAHKSIN